MQIELLIAKSQGMSASRMLLGTAFDDQMTFDMARAWDKVLYEVRYLSNPLEVNISCFIPRCRV